MPYSKLEKENTSILTIRVPDLLKTRLQYLASERHMKVSEVAKRYLFLSDVFTITGEYAKIDSDNQNLILYPDKLIEEVFNLINKIPSKDRFKTRLELGDQLGGYINNIRVNVGLHKNDYYAIFKQIIGKLGWFKIAFRSVTPSSSLILIPKDFPKDYGDKSLVYSMIYRIVTGKKYPDEWTEDLLNERMPHTGSKLNRDQTRENEEFERKYNQYVFKPLEPDLEQQKLDHYYFNVLVVQNPTF